MNNRCAPLSNNTKVEDMLSTDLEGVGTQSVSKATKLLAETTLTQLKVKNKQIVQLDATIADKIEGDEEFEEEIINTGLDPLMFEIKAFHHECSSQHHCEV